MNENILCIVPPYVSTYAPAGPAALLGYLKTNGVDFDFLDFRYWLRNAESPTYTPLGVFGETFVHDVSELPIILSLLRAYREGRPLLSGLDDILEAYCVARGVSATRHAYFLKSLDRFFEKATAQMGQPRFVGFSIWVTNFLTTLIAAAHLKRRFPEVYIVAGGPQISQSPNSAKMALKSGIFDAVVKGEGEGPLLQLYKEFQSGEGQVKKPVPGVMRYIPDENQFELTANDQLKIGDLPLPDFSKMPLWMYQRDEKMSLPLGLTRGCTDKCSFCSEWVFWRHYRSDDPNNLLNKIHQLVKNYKMQRIYFSDSLLNGHPKRLEAFAQGLIEQNLNLEWWSFMRAQITPEMANLVHRSGCKNIFVGIESMSDATLELMNKRRTEADNIKALRIFLEAGIHVVAGMIPGFPGDSRESFLRSVKIIRSLQEEYPFLLDFNVEPFTVYPGQPIYQDLSKFGLTPQPWPEEILDIDPHFKDITSNIHCTVTGKNQGIERLGQFQVCRGIAAFPGQNINAVQSFGLNANINPHGMTFTSFKGGWHIGSLISPHATVYSVILSDDEKEEYLEKASQVPLYPLENQTMREFFKKIEKQHLVVSAANKPEVRVSGHHYNLDQKTRIMLSPIVVARELSNLGQILILEMNRPEAHFVLPTEFVPPKVLEFLKEPRTIADLRKGLSRLGLPNDEASVRLIVDLLHTSRAIVWPSNLQRPASKPMYSNRINRRFSQGPTP